MCVCVLCFVWACSCLCMGMHLCVNLCVCACVNRCVCEWICVCVSESVCVCVAICMLVHVCTSSVFWDWSVSDCLLIRMLMRGSFLLQTGVCDTDWKWHGGCWKEHPPVHISNRLINRPVDWPPKHSVSAPGARDCGTGLRFTSQGDRTGWKLNHDVQKTRKCAAFNRFYTRILKKKKILCN